MTKNLFIFLFCVVSAHSWSQKNNYLSFELLGSGGLGSLNFEHQFFDRDKTDLIFRSGLSFMPIDKNNGTAVIFPLMVHSVFGEGNFKADVGLGQTLTVTTKGQFFFRMPFSAGMRFEPQDKRYYLRLSYTPIISYIYNFQWEHWGGFTYGFKLTK